MYSVKTALWTMMKQMGIEKRINHKMACLVWDDVVGAEIRANTNPAYVRSGILFVMVRSSSWANQLTFLKRDLIRKLNQNLEDEIIRDIRFQVGFIGRNELLVQKKEVEEVETVDFCELDDDEHRKVTEISEDVEDPELQHKLKELLTTDFRHRKGKAKKGFKKCTICGVYVDEFDNVCYICKQTVDGKRIDKVQAILEDAPWLSNAELQQLLPGAIVSEYEIARSRLIGETEKQLDGSIIDYMHDATLENCMKMKTLAYKLTFLASQTEPNSLDSLIIADVIGKDRQRIVFGVH